MIVEGISHNLISVSELLEKNSEIVFKTDNKNTKYTEISIRNETFNCSSINNLFYLQVDFTNENCYNVKNANDNSNIWHKRLGHLNRYGSKQLGLPYTKEICNSCEEGKSTRNRFYESEIKTNKIAQIIHTNTAGPIVTPSSEGYRYFQVLINDYLIK